MAKWAVRIMIGVGLVCSILATTILCRAAFTKKSMYTSHVRQPICGIVSVMNVCSLSGIEVSFEETLKAIGSVSRRDVSMLDCKRALEQFGVKSTALHVRSVGEIHEVAPAICVLHVKKGLHAAVMIRRGDRILLIDGRTIEQFTVREIDRFSNGMVLVTY